MAKIMILCILLMQLCSIYCHSVDICLNSKLDIRCKVGEEIKIHSAAFGIVSIAECLRAEHRNIDCKTDVTGLLEEKCSGKASCSMDVPNEKITKLSLCDFNPSQHLNVNYSCVPVDSLEEYCAFDLFHPKCRKDEMINIEHAYYGRSKSDKCAKTDYANNCSADVTKVLAERCKGKSTCATNVLNPVLTAKSPCGEDVYSSLKVKYACVSRTFTADYCQAFSVNCPEGTEIRIDKASYGRMKSSKCLGKHPVKHLGCQTDVTEILAADCKGWNTCSMFDFEFDRMRTSGPCPLDLVSYLSVTHSCIIPARK